MRKNVQEIHGYSYTVIDPQVGTFDNTMLEDECFGCVNIKEGRFPVSHNSGIFWLDTEGRWRRLGEPMNMVQIYYCPICGRKLDED